MCTLPSLSLSLFLCISISFSGVWHFHTHTTYTQPPLCPCLAEPPTRAHLILSRYLQNKIKKKNFKFQQIINRMEHYFKEFTLFWLFSKYFILFYYSSRSLQMSLLICLISVEKNQTEKKYLYIFSGFVAKATTPKTTCK